jgi:DNA-binding NarL/FixJ family response regulator
MPRVLIVDDHAVIRRGVQGILSTYPEWDLCGEADNGQDAIRLAGELAPEVVIMDVSMPGMNGLEATRIIHDVLPESFVAHAAFFLGIRAQRVPGGSQRLRFEIGRGK